MSRPISTEYMQHHHTLTVNDRLLKLLSSTTCRICIDEFMHHDKILRLHCRHVFHKQCLRAWFSTHNTCPICRQDYPEETPNPCFVPINTQRHRLRLLKKPVFANRRDHEMTVFRLHFHIRGSHDSDQGHVCSKEQKVLEKLLVEIGFRELANVACEPFWISAHDRIRRRCVCGDAFEEIN